MAFPVFVSGMALGQAPSQTGKGETGKDPGELKAICKEYESVRKKWFQQYFKAKSEKKRAKLLETLPKATPYCERLLRIIEKDPKSKASADALVWITRYALGSTEGEKPFYKALDLLGEHHISLPQMGTVCLDLRRNVKPEVRRFARRVMEHSSSKEARGQALFALGVIQKRLAELGRQLALDPSQAPSFKKRCGAETLRILKETPPEVLRKKALELFARCRKEASDISLYGRTTLGKAAQREVFELEHLLPGMVAPEIQGEDIGGQTFKLSDYRGKVVMLDFWGDW